MHGHRWRAAPALLALAPAAAAQEAAPAIPQEHRAQAGRAQDMVDRLEAGDKTASSLAAARALREECLASGNHRSAKFLAGSIVASFPEQLADHHRYVEILLVRGAVEPAIEALRALVKERPTDCATYAMLSELLVEQGLPARAMDVHAAHLREHAGEAGPLYARAAIALWELRDTTAARAEAEALRRAALEPRVGRETAEWLRSNAAVIEEGAARMEKDRGILGAASRRLDRFLWGTLVGVALALGAAGWFTRRRA